MKSYKEINAMKTIKLIEVILLVCAVALVSSKSRADEVETKAKKIVKIDFTSNELEYRDIIFDESEGLEVHVSKDKKDEQE